MFNGSSLILLASFPALRNSFSTGLFEGAAKQRGMKYVPCHRKIPARRRRTRRMRERVAKKRIKSRESRKNNTQISERNFVG